VDKGKKKIICKVRRKGGAENSGEDLSLRKATTEAEGDLKEKKKGFNI